MKEMPRFQQIERQVEEEAKEWKRKRMEELIKEFGPEQAEVSPPEPAKVDQAKTRPH